VGGVAAFVLLAYVVPTPDVDGDLTSNLGVFAVFMAIVWPLGALLSRTQWKPVERWLVADRPPDAREIELTVQQPLRQVLAGGSGWLFAALFFAALNARESLPLAFEVGVVVLDAGVVTCALSYLLVERTLRPVTARALAFGLPERPGLPDVRTRLTWTWMLGTGVILADLMLIAMLVLAGTPASTERLAVTMLALGLVGTVVGWGAIMVAAQSVSDPVKAMRAALARVEEGDTTVQTPVYDASEIGLLQAGFNRMVAGLRERELLRDLFGRHVGEDVARNALDRGLELGGETREVAVVFVDLIGSTAMAAKREPAEVVATLNAFFSIVVEEVSVRGGWVNKFEGDAALCVFGAPTGHPSAAASALAAGRALHDRLARELPEADAGIGLSAGSVVAGNVGAAERFEYTVIGDPVNEAARLTELAKGTPARLLASEAILERAGAAEAGRWELGEQVTLRGRDRVTRLATPR
jgi:adenylate cyclase